MKFNKIYKEYRSSPNKIYVIEKYKSYILSRSLFLGFLFAFAGYFFIENKHILESFTSSVKMLTFDAPKGYKSNNILFPIALTFIGFVIFYTVLTTFFKNIINSNIVTNIKKQKHTVIFGLSNINRAFLDDENNSTKNIIIIEKDKNNQYIEQYRNKGFGIEIEDIINSNLNKDNYRNMECGIIALGDDRKNLDLAINLIDLLNDTNNSKPKRLIIHIENDQLKELFNQKLLNFEDLNKAKIDIKTFSYFEECSNDLFEKYSFISNEKIQTNDDIKSIILGNGDLALNIIKNLLLLSNLPNKNQHYIYILDDKADEFYEKFELKASYSKEKFPTINIIPINISYKNISYFKQDLFTDYNLSNIYICYDDEQINLNLSIELNDKILIKKDIKANIFLSLFNSYSFIKDYKFIDKFTVFGNIKEIFSKNRLIDEENYLISKLIHNGYGDEFTRENLILDEQSLNKKWFNIHTYSDRLSSIAQAKHLNIKLQSLGLYKIKSNENKKILLEKNIKIFDEILNPILEKSNINYDFIHQASLELEKIWSNQVYEVKYFPEEYKTLFEKLIECEHERWNSFHYLNGWEYHMKKDKSRKLHNCLKPIYEFKEPELKITILYDIYAILYLPNYLASAGYEMKKLN
ncbi:hypothetical protein [Aliarcobacter cryaerophilus]|uniref:hypothetical protein n=1 Tax=Aliarcobacter cryaerophilus TaxID=28198 RepID=UPI00112F0E78|nr:hypothetical protein [Aliarcobacter cryaerophilus]